MWGTSPLQRKRQRTSPSYKTWMTTERLRKGKMVRDCLSVGRLVCPRQAASGIVRIGKHHPFTCVLLRIHCGEATFFITQTLCHSVPQLFVSLRLGVQWPGPQSKQSSPGSSKHAWIIRRVFAKCSDGKRCRQSCQKELCPRHRQWIGIHSRARLQILASDTSTSNKTDPLVYYKWWWAPRLLSK